MWQQLLDQLIQGDIKALARSISLVENEYGDYEQLLTHLPVHEQTKVVGITGPPGAGKSTLVDGLIQELVQQNNRVAVLCVDPSSPFNLGAVLGDRIRMSEWYNHPNVFIRSLATRGSMGGLHPKIIEITELVKAAAYDYVLIETVGVGQSEIEIAGLADVTIVVLVPEAGDEVQTMKAGLMEIADVFVVNKADRPDADTFVKNLRLMLAPAFSTHKHEIPVIKTIAAQKQGLKELTQGMEQQFGYARNSDKRFWLLAEKAYQLIQSKRMKNVYKEQLKAEITTLYKQGNFNLYRYATAHC